MNYYRRYVGDYLRDTSRLSMLEHGAYNLLLDYYYAEERPIAPELDDVYRMVRAILPEERRAVVKVLSIFFQKTEGGYHHKRVDKEIATAKAVIEKQRLAGAESASKRWSTDRSTHESSDSSTDAAPIHPPTTNHQPPLSNHQKKDIVRLKPDLKPQAVEVLNFLNGKTGRQYKPKPGTLEPILARLREGATVDDLRAVVAKKCRDWVGDPKMNEYLRPKTLFRRENYANYEGELTATEPAEKVAA